MSSKLGSRGSRRERGRRCGRHGGRHRRGVDVGIGVAIVGQVQFQRRPRRAAPFSVLEPARSRLAQPSIRAELASLVEGVARDARGAQQLHGADAAVTLDRQTDTDRDNGQRAEDDEQKAEHWATGAAGPAAFRRVGLTARPMVDGRRSGGALGGGRRGPNWLGSARTRTTGRRGSQSLARCPPLLVCWWATPATASDSAVCPEVAGLERFEKTSLLSHG